METYHKIKTLFKRDLGGPNKGRMIEGEWTTPELAYLAPLAWEFTEKVDGTNIRIECAGLTNMHGSDRGTRIRFAGRSDNASIPDPLLRYLDATFTTDLFAKADLKNIILFGEGYGPKIQGGGKYRDDHSFVLFDVKIGPWWLDRENVDDIAKKLGIDSVPTIGHGTLYDGITRVRGGMRSTWGDFNAEGIVARPYVPMFDRKGERIITKIKTVDFQ